MIRRQVIDPQQVFFRNVDEGIDLRQGVNQIAVRNHRFLFDFRWVCRLGSISLSGVDNGGAGMVR
jgi:hypothetical protein